ncbi:hypothetical protein CA850_32255 [Micromonospora echinospora]|nr:hypothetical protein CA850_32255 [Micromonospora echinospora]
MLGELRGDDAGIGRPNLGEIVLNGCARAGRARPQEVGPVAAARRGDVQQSQVEPGDNVPDIAQPRQVPTMATRTLQHQQCRHRFQQRRDRKPAPSCVTAAEPQHQRHIADDHTPGFGVRRISASQGPLAAL